MNHDELMALMKEDELVDQADSSETRIMGVRDYAKARGVAPQRVYYYLRGKKLVPEMCECGRLCVNVEEADAIFRPKDKVDQDEQP